MCHNDAKPSFDSLFVADRNYLCVNRWLVARSANMAMCDLETEQIERPIANGR